MTYKAKELGRERGTDLSMIKMMEGALLIKHLDYQTLLANYVSFRVTGISHEEVMELLIIADNAG